MLKKTDAIKNVLTALARPELADLYSPNMEVQVNVAQDNGERIEGEYKGVHWSGWTDGVYTWKAIRIPYHAKTTPEYNLESEIKFDLAAHAEAIGMTGWDWVNKRSRWVAFDFDAIIGHSDKHSAKLTDDQLKEVRDIAINIPWVTVRQSTSGNGLHLYVFLDGVETANHTEHQALGRAILGKLSALTGYDFNAKVDNCGGNIWVWHRKYQTAGGISGPGLRLIKQGTVLKEIPPNWKDHIKVAAGRKRRTLPQFVETEEVEADEFMELCGQRVHVPLDPDHRKLIEWLETSRDPSHDYWWDADNHMLVCHTIDLQSAHEALGFRGTFKTLSSGSSTQNCFCFPMRRGAWSVRRHTAGVQEHESWDQDGSGWTRCYLNRDPDLQTAAKITGGTENDKGHFIFRETETAISAAAQLGAHADLPPWMLGREARLRPHKDGRLIFEIKKNDSDNPQKLEGWSENKGFWQRIFNTQTPEHYEAEVNAYEDLIRHMVVEPNKDAGWCIKSDGGWCDERIEHVKHVLASMGISRNEINIVLGSSILRKWTLVTRPFEPEYPGDRQWNRDAAQFSVAPTLDTDSLHYPTWRMILSHCGSGLDFAVKDNKWCRAHGVATGADYLMLWISHMFQKPLEPLPYLFFYGPQDSGKSILHEALSMLVTKGVERADAALVSGPGFNGELEGKILCVVEETDLRINKSAAYNRIKDWVTSDRFPIHRKNATPYTVPNSTHWMQCANDQGYCPIFPGDTRIVMSFVGLPENPIPKYELKQRLKKEAPDFLAAILAYDIPPPIGRLGIPIIATEEKKQSENANRSVLEEFLAECTHPIDGEVIKLSTLHERFVEWLPPSLVNEWTNIRFGREMVKLGYVKGRLMTAGAQFHIGNISFENVSQKRPKIVLEGDKLV